MAQLLVLNGPNLNMLGLREPETYGNDTLASIESTLRRMAEQSKVELDFIQSNAEHVLIERLHLARTDGTDFIIINPAAYTHTSVALRDAILSSETPFLELHLSNTHAREDYRSKSYFSDIATGVIMGFGAFGYELAFAAAMQQLSR